MKINRSAWSALMVTLCLTPAALAFPNDLLFSEADLPRIRANTEDPALRAYWRELRDKDIHADKDFLREAFIYVIDGEEERAQNALKYLMETVRLDRWHHWQDRDGTPVGFLRTAAKTASVALAYDWLYPHLSPADRAEVLDALANKGCQPMYHGLYGMKHPDEVLGWEFVPGSPFMGVVQDFSRFPHILGHNNFRAVVNGGLALGLFVIGDNDERSAEWEAILLESIPFFNSLIQDDGSYDEAVSYINYALKYQIMAMEVVKRKRGIDFFDTANFTGLIDFVLAMYLPNHLERHGSISFGDAGPSLESFAAFWIAHETRDSQAQHLGLNYANHYWSSFLYYDPSVRPAPPTDGNNFVETELDWVIYRTGYEVDDLVLAMRSGAPMNHEHADRNSIMLKAYGEILLADTVPLTYDGRTPEWVMRTAQGHNMILIDGQGIEYHDGREGVNASRSSAKIVRRGERSGHVFWTSDATPAYALITPDVRSVTRSVILFPTAPCLIVIDKVTKTSDPSVISARWHLESKDQNGSIHVEDANRFTIHRPNARLHLQVAGPPGWSTRSGRLDFPAIEKEYHFAETTSDQSAQEALLITVATPLRPDEADPVAAVSFDASRWEINYLKQGSRIKLQVHDRGPIPEFEVIRNDFRP